MSDRLTEDDEPRIRVDGRDYLGWKALRISRGIDRVASSFDFEANERWAQFDAPWQIQPFTPLEIFFGNDLLLTGHVDRYEAGFDAQRHDVRIVGRSRTADLVDCSPDLGGEFRASTLEALARRIARPFGIGVVNEAPVGAPLPLAAIEPTETAFDFLERQARLRGVLLADDGAGNLVLTRAGAAEATDAILQGDNVVTGRASLDVAERFSVYRVLAQRGTSGAGGWGEINDETPAPTAGGAAQPGIAGEARDGAVPRYRPRTRIADQAMGSGEAQALADWWADFQAGQSIKATFLVEGWRQRDGSLWQPNRLVRVRAPWLQIDDTLLIAAVTWTLDAEGRKTEIEVAPPSAFTPEPTAAPARTVGGKSTAGGGKWAELNRP